VAKKKLLLWLSQLACNANAHSLLNHPSLEEFQKSFDWLYHPLLPSLSSLDEILDNYEEMECDILLIDGALCAGLSKKGVRMRDMLEHFAKSCSHILTVGTCATYGGIFSAGGEDRSGLHFDGEKRLDGFSDFFEKSISLPGCPVHPEIVVAVITALAQGLSLPLDSYRRPKGYYGYTVHDGCSRNEYFEYKIDRHDFGHLEGCMFYEHGCRGTYSAGSCNMILWNGVSSKTRVGEPCHGCTEADFPTRGLWRTEKHMGIPARLPLGVSKRAYLSLAGVAKAFRIDRFHRRILEDEE
jgi:hydrogenase small subunit